MLSVYTEDRPGLFYRLAGAISLAGGNIIDARIHTTRDGMALDNLLVLDPRGQPYSDRRLRSRLVRSVEAALTSVAPPNQMKNTNVRNNFLKGAREDLIAMGKQFPGAKGQIRGLVKELDTLGLTHVKPKVDADTKGAQGKLSYMLDSGFEISNLFAWRYYKQNQQLDADYLDQNGLDSGS